MLRLSNGELDKALEEALDAGYLAPVDLASEDVPSIGADQHGEFRDGFAPLTRLIAGLWSRIADRDPLTARDIARVWSSGRFLLQRRLHLFAQLNQTVFTAADVRQTVSGLSDQEFWLHGFDRELRALLAARWNDFDGTGGEIVESRILAGIPAKLLHRPVPDQASVRDWLSVQMLYPIRQAGGRLSERAEMFLNDALARYGPVGLDVSEERFDTIQPANDQTIDVLDGVADHELFARAFEDVEAAWPFESSLWFPLCRADPRRALRAMSAASERDDRFSRALSTLLSVAGESPASDIDSGLTALLLHDGPSAVSERLALAVASWLRTRATHRAKEHLESIPEDVLEAWDFAASVLVDESDQTLPGDASITLDDALNSGAGSLAWALQSWMATLDRTNAGGFGPEIMSRLDRLVQSCGSIGMAARAFLVAHLAFLHHFEPDWTERHLVPLLLRQGAESLALWAILAGRPIGPPRLFALLKPAFARAVVNAANRNDRTAELALNLVQLAVWWHQPNTPRFDLPPAEIRALIRESSSSFRHAASKHFFRYMAGQRDPIQSHSERWLESARPTVLSVWPLDVHLRDAETSKTFVNMVFHCETAFPDAVDVVTDMIGPYEIIRIGAWLLYDAQSQELARRHPAAFTRLLDAILGDQPIRMPDDLPIYIDAARRLTLDRRSQAALNRLEALRRRMP